MKKLRLILDYTCHKDCKGCCNKQSPFTPNEVERWDWNLNGFDQLILTGGELLLDPLRVYSFLMAKALAEDKTPTYLYTAYACDFEMFFLILRHLDGITFTIHDQEDVNNFLRLNFYLAPMRRYIQDNNKSMRLHIFKEVKISLVNPTFWKIKDNIEWIPNCPLPEDEVIRQI